MRTRILHFGNNSDQDLGGKSDGERIRSGQPHYIIIPDSKIVTFAIIVVSDSIQMMPMQSLPSLDKPTSTVMFVTKTSPRSIDSGIEIPFPRYQFKNIQNIRAANNLSTGCNGPKNNLI